MVSKEDVIKISQLARVSLEEAEIQNIQKKISQLLEHFQSLASVDTSSVEPLYHATSQMMLREDEPEPSLSVEDLMRNAPDHSDACFRLPKVVGGAE